MNRLSKFAIISISITLLSCNNNNKIENEQEPTSQSEQQVTKPKRVLKIPIFNNPKELLNKLSKNGIGELKGWENPEEMGWGSLTDYYFFGEKKDGFGMQNNLAYYIEGEENFAKIVLLNLNINNAKSKKDAVKLFSETAEKTFKTLEIETPKGVLSAIKNFENYKTENNNFSTKLSIEKYKIEVMKLEIVSN